MCLWLQLDLSNNRLCGLYKNSFTGEVRGTYNAEGITVIANALKVTPSLTSLDAHGNDLDAQSKQALREAVKGHKRSIDLKL